ncbi:MAG: hypothetical protein R8G01_17955 [Ilumatobacteraceae bacterium]|nr:hypothetical protein [Ilumatobacteraceae bacterium]
MTVDGLGLPGGPIGTNDTVELVVTGRGGVPAASVAAVVLNVTATGPTAPSFLTAWPTGEARPEASNVNFVPGQSVPNLVVAKVGTGGKVSIFNRFGTVDVVVDVAGYFPETDGFEPLIPARLLDTRPGTTTIDGRELPGNPIGAAGRFDLGVLGRGGVPASGVDAVVLNVAVTNPTSPSFITVWPAGQTRPVASNLNTAPGETRANLVIAKVGTDGKVSIFNLAGSVDVIVDVAGYFTTGGTFVPLQPARLLETRPGESVTPGGTNRGMPVGQGDELEFPVLGIGGVPLTGVSSVVLNVTAVGADAPSFLTVWPYGSQRPETSNLNMRGGGHTVPNLVIAKLGAGGKVSIYNLAGNPDVVVDVAGYFVEEPAAIRSVVADARGTCSIDSLGRVSCWGSNPQDEFAFQGLATPPSRFAPYPLGIFDDAVDVAIDWTHTCFLRSDGTVWCRGGGGVIPVLGDGQTDVRWIAIQVPGLDDVVDVETGYLNTCALRSVGTVHCWGAGFGAGTLATPTQIAGLSDIAEIEVADEYACARRSDGRVLCWGGMGSTGVLGDGSGTDSEAPRLVAGLTDATSISLGSLRGCAVRTNSQAACWGNSMLGNGTTGRSLTPVDVKDATTGEPAEEITEIAGGDDWACALRTDQNLYCWGSQSAATAGLAPSTSADTTQIAGPVHGLAPVTSISGGRFHACVTTTDHDIMCWGFNESGQVGDGTNQVQPTPTLVIDSP